jgi:hypothetical protein
MQITRVFTWLLVGLLVLMLVGTLILGAAG